MDCAFTVSVQAEDFDLAAELAAVHGGQSEIGALASFVGLVRDDGALAGGEALLAMSLEHYPGMTEKALAAIVAEARQRWPLLAVRLVHRVGRLLPGAQIVLVAVASRHRGAAFAACEFIMDLLKTSAPFWKSEERASGSHWVDARDSDDTAAARWLLEPPASA